MPVKDCFGLEKFVTAIGEIQRRFFARQLSLAQARTQAASLLKEAVVENPECAAELRKTVTQVDSEMVQEQLERGKI